jgi:HSP20 family protein
MLLSGATVRDLERLTARVFDNPDHSPGCRLKAYRIDEGYFVDVVLPGADPAGIDITVDGGVLTVRAERERAERERAEQDRRPADGPVSRQVTLAETLDTDRLDARYADGVLTLTIPVASAPEPREPEAAGV